MLNTLPRQPLAGKPVTIIGSGVSAVEEMEIVSGCTDDNEKADHAKCVVLYRPNTHTPKK